jgi:hypothetical protein
MFPDGDTKLAALTTLGGATDGAGGVGASPSAAFVGVGDAVGAAVGCGSGLPGDAEHATATSASVIAAPSLTHPLATAISPSKAE